MELIPASIRESIAAFCLWRVKGFRLLNNKKEGRKQLTFAVFN